jgi:hypothetical protein
MRRFPFSPQARPMPDWLTGAFPSDAELRWENILVRLIAALVVGSFVAAIYRWTRRGSVPAHDLSQTLLLLALVIAMITLAIGDNAARAFSLVGALAIVRFRSVVENPRDTAFVILAVAVCLAVGASFIVVPLLGLPLAGLVASCFARLEGVAWPCSVAVRCEPTCSSDAVRAVLERHLDDCRTRRIATVNKGSLVEQAWSGRLKSEVDGHELVRSLQGTPGVVGVKAIVTGLQRRPDSEESPSRICESTCRDIPI